MRVPLDLTSMTSSYWSGSFCSLDANAQSNAMNAGLKLNVIVVSSHDWS